MAWVPFGLGLAGLFRVVNRLGVGMFHFGMGNVRGNLGKLSAFPSLVLFGGFGRYLPDSVALEANAAHDVGESQNPLLSPATRATYHFASLGRLHGLGSFRVGVGVHFHVITILSYMSVVH